MLNRLERYDLLILDDLAYVRKDHAETIVLFELISVVMSNVPVLITANQPFTEWTKVFPDENTAVAAVDRLVHHCVILENERGELQTPSSHGKKKKQEAREVRHRERLDFLIPPHPTRATPGFRVASPELSRYCLFRCDMKVQSCLSQPFNLVCRAIANIYAMKESPFRSVFYYVVFVKISKTMRLHPTKDSFPHARSY